MTSISKARRTGSTTRLVAVLLSASTAVATALVAFAGPATASLETDSGAHSLDAQVPRTLPAVGDCTNSVYEYSSQDRTDSAWKYVGAGGGMVKVLCADLKELLATEEAPSEVYRDFKAAGHCARGN